MIVQACLNGARPRGYHAELPVSPAEMARDAAAVVRAGAAADPPLDAAVAEDAAVRYCQSLDAYPDRDANGNVVFSASAGVAVFHVAHNHWHQNDVADFVLRAGSLNGPIVAKATKITYCLIDYDKSDLVHENRERAYWDDQLDQLEDRAQKAGVPQDWRE